MLNFNFHHLILIERLKFKSVNTSKCDRYTFINGSDFKPIEKEPLIILVLYLFILTFLMEACWKGLQQISKYLKLP